ncbi:MAG: DUF4266 domain-containing protein [Candidatus Eisenbacteria bacterium]
MKRLLFVCVAVSALAGSTSGCAHVGVDPWDRDILAEPEMSLDADAVDLGLDDHIYFSKEASSGGRGFGGGGCGCN